MSSSAVRLAALLVFFADVAAAQPAANPLPSWTSSVGRLDTGLDVAKARGWTVVDMRRDWKVVYPAEQK